MAFKGDTRFRRFTDEEMEQWVRVLRQLGRFWQIALRDLLATARQAVGQKAHGGPDVYGRLP